MFETLRTGLATWARSTTDKQKLQHTYVVLLGVVVIASGLVALFNGSRSRQLMYVAIVLITTLLTNFVVWALLESAVLNKLPRQTRNSRR